MEVRVESGRSTCIHVINSLGFGGAEKILVFYAKYHDRDKYRVEVVSFYPGGEMIEEIESHGVKVHILGTRSSDPRSFFRLKKLFGNLDARIVHFHNPLPLYAGLPAALRSHVPVKVMTEHNIYYPGRTGGRLNSAVYLKLRRKLDTVIACSQEVREDNLHSLDPERLITVSNGVDLNQFEPSGARAAPDRYHIGTVGSLTPKKGYRYLIEAVSILASREIPAELTFVGDGPLRNELEHQVIKAGLGERVHFAGTMADISGALNTFDVFAGSSLREGLPLVVLEAMASGKPVVTTDVGGNGEAVIDGTTGLLVPPGDPYALADALEILWMDGDKRALMGKAGRARVEEHFSASRMVAETERIYESLL
jgi:glycosyltransferase involved in cell wall biosynthesis